MRSCRPYGYIRVRKYYIEKYSESKSLQIQSQHREGKHQLSIEGVDLDYFNNDIMVIDSNSSCKFYLYLIKNNKKDGPDTHGYMVNL